MTDPSGGITSYHYDAASNLTETDFPNGTKEIRHYDTLNRLVYLENDGPSGVISSYTLHAEPDRAPGIRGGKHRAARSITATTPSTG